MSQQFKVSPYDGEKEVKKIAFVVESPHKSEFTCCFKPIRPLNGVSGERFDAVIFTKLCEWFRNELSEKTVYEIKIFNPVKYQASLYHYLNNQNPNDRLPQQVHISYNFDEDLKNNVWRALFESEKTKCKEDFINDIRSYSPDYIVNSCTGPCIENLRKEWSTFDDINYRGGKNLKALTKSALIDFKKKLPKTVKYREDTHPASW